MNDQNNDTDLDPAVDEFETEARALGWQPESEYRGDPARFTSAKEFVEKGRHVVPILQHNNKRLQKQLLTRDEKIGKLELTIKELHSSLETFEKRLSKMDQQSLARAKAQLVDELKVARESGDVQQEVEVQDRISLLRNAAEDKPAAKPAPVTNPVELHPTLKAWMAKNPWFGDQASKDSRAKTKEYLRIGEDLRDEGFEGDMDDYVEAVERAYEKRHAPVRTPSKVESGRGSSGSPGTGKKGWADLPADAKAACNEFSSTLVGPNKRYKTVDDWRAKYAKDYFEDVA